jgi:hypothetical protein
VGWSAVSWKTLKETRPTRSVRVRALVRPVDYYNFRFSSETEWESVALVSPLDSSTLYGYARRNSETFLRLPFREDSKERSMVLDIRYPKNSPTDNQVLIEAVAAEGWLDLGDPVGSGPSD